MKSFLALHASVLVLSVAALFFESTAVVAFSNNAIITSATNPTSTKRPRSFMTLQSSAEDAAVATATDDAGKEEEEIDYEIPEDAVINIKPKAMKRLRELREKQTSGPDSFMVLRMGVRNGGCSGLSYVMDFATEDDVEEDDCIDEYTAEKLQCVVDAKSMLYLYGLELDYSEELIGGGFKFFNPNAEDSCGCGSSFGV